MRLSALYNFSHLGKYPTYASSPYATLTDHVPFCNVRFKVVILISFHSHFIAIRGDVTELLGQIELFFTHGNACHRFYVDSGKRLNIHEIPELHCDHGEADTRLLLHTKHATPNYDGIVIRSPDTDVFILLIGLKSSLDAAVYMDTGTGNNRRIISIDQLSEDIGPEMCSALIGFHSFTGSYSLISKYLISFNMFCQM